MRDKRRPYGTVLAVIARGSARCSPLALVGSALALRPVSTPSCRPCSGCIAVWMLLDGLAVVPRAFFERELTIGSLVAPEIWRGVVIAVGLR